jgi:hypothetical protein
VGRLVAVGLLAVACSTSASKADTVALCNALTADLKGAGLAGTPTSEQASAAAVRLDPRVTQVADPGLHEAVVRLHQHLHEVDVAWRKRGSDDAARAADRARKDAQQAARACHLPAETFVTS